MKNFGKLYNLSVMGTESGVIVDRESYEYDHHTKSNPLEVRLRELYKKAKAECKE